MSSQSGRHSWHAASNELPLLFLVRIPTPRLLFLFVPVQDKGQVQVNDKEWLLGTTGCCSWHSKNATPSPQIHTTVRPSLRSIFPTCCLLLPLAGTGTPGSLYPTPTPPLCCAAWPLSHSHPCPLCGGLACFSWCPGGLGAVCGRCLLA